MHEKISTTIDPCEQAEGYVYQNCMYREIMSRIGCQPFWLDFIMTDLPNCTEASQIFSFLDVFSNLTGVSSEKELKADYSCLRPCKYMEYKVRLTY